MLLMMIMMIMMMMIDMLMMMMMVSFLYLFSFCILYALTLLLFFYSLSFCLAFPFSTLPLMTRVRRFNAHKDCLVCIVGDIAGGHYDQGRDSECKAYYYFLYSSVLPASLTCLTAH